MSELRAALLAAGIGDVAEVRAHPSPYRTSFPLERVEVTLADGEMLQLAWKRLDWDQLEPAAQVAKPRFLHDPEREPAVYASLLGAAPPGPPRYFGSVLEPQRHWLLVEWVEGRELYQVGERALWESAANWLGRFHVACEGAVESDADAARLLVHDAGFYRLWIERAREFAREPGAPPGRAEALDWLAERHGPVVEALLAEPRTVLHGEFYASNVLVADDLPERRVPPVDKPSPSGVAPIPRVAPVDWEVAAVGPGISDLAALVSGGWSERDRGAIAAAYASAAGATIERLDYARLQLAIQWLGWAPPSWRPPEEQQHDWLGEAVALAEGLDL
jgi:Ser/Thr protein kinase RdoA (MazF antagonist)